MIDDLEYGVASVDDLPRIVDLKLSMFLESGHIDLLASDAQETILGDYRELYMKKEAIHFIARVRGNIVALVGAFVKCDLPFRYYRNGTYGFIGDVYTDPSFRGHGIATRLSQEALQWFNSRGIVMVRLLAADAGRSIYEKLGFISSDEMILCFLPNQAN